MSEILFKVIIATATFCFIILPTTGTSQGMLFDDVLHRQQPRLVIPDEGNKADYDLLKGVVKADLKPYCPEPQDQGFISSCTGWACGYGALTITNAIKNNWAGQTDLITQNAFSALFIYNQIKKGSCDFGAYITDAAAFLRDKGDVYSKEFDKLKNNCDRSPTDQEITTAQSFRVKDFLAVFGPDDPGTSRIQRMKLCLAQKRPVVVGITLLKNFQTIPKGFEYWYPNIGDTTHNGGHSMVVVGFDDGREAFEVMNSWGTDWGNDGFAWIRYRDVEAYFNYGYIFIGHGEKNGFQDLIASVKIKRPVYNEMDVLSFAEEKVKYVNGYYQLESGHVTSGALLQPFLQEAKQETYFYFFSLDARNEIHVHWPRDSKLDSRFENEHESGFIPYRDVQIAIPGKFAALQLKSTGTEYWCFLFSGKPIEKINDLLQVLKNNVQPDFNKRIRKVFGATLLSQERVRFSPDRMQAETDLSDHEMVALVLKVTVR